VAEFILEILSEEVPAHMQVPMSNKLEAELVSVLEKEKLYYTSIKNFVTPRRMVVTIDGLSLTQEDLTVEKRGPKVGADEKALAGFLRNAGLKKEDLTVKETPKGSFYFAITKEYGRPTKDVLLESIENILPSFTWPKSMRWGSNDIRWVRPIKNIMALFGAEILPIKFGHLEANNLSEGHRFLSDGTFEVTSFKEYEKELRKRFVILDSNERKEIITNQINDLASSHDLKIIKDDYLLEEVAGLVEYPEALIGKIEKEFMHIPEEVLISSIRSHQKYFSLRTAEGNLASYFITISNIKSKKGDNTVISGNERVLRARLADAKFFWDQDLKTPLEDKFDNLEKIIFHKKLGSVADKTRRIQASAKFLSVWIPHANLKKVDQAATLSKIDLVTEMVGEFPDLQGVMGYHYATKDGADDEVALAIKEHYSPLGNSDHCPKSPASIAIALADKLDTLVGLFAVNEKPTGSKDPFALRRAAIGVIRIILENNLSIPLRIALDNSLKHYPSKLLKQANESDEEVKKSLLKIGKSSKTPPSDITDELLHFFGERIKALLKSENVRHDLISAVFDDGNEDDILRLVRRVATLSTFINLDDGINLLAAYKRASNIVEIEEKKDNRSYASAPNKGLLEQNDEINLYNKLQEIKPEIKKLLKENEFESVMSLLSELRSPIDLFFENVKVNCDDEDIRKNRLKLLSQMRYILKEIANFSHIEG